MHCMDAGFDVSEGVARRDSAEGAGGEVEEAQSDRQLGDEHLPLRYYISMRSLPWTQQVRSSSFRDLVIVSRARLFSDEFILVFVYLSPILTHCDSLHYCGRFSMSPKVQ